MRNLKIVALILLVASFGAGCGRSGSDNDAIRSAINSHLAARGNLNTSAFDTEIQKVDVQGDEAKADVAFHVKGGPGVMQLTYNLKKTGGTWSVVESNPVGSNFTHPALDANGAPASSATPGGAAPDIMDSMRQKMAAPAK
jgi:hypothetical protein